MIRSLPSIKPYSAIARAARPRRTLALASAAITVVGITRVVVALIEAWVVVRDERRADEDLMALCSHGSASSSADFRTLCMKKRSEQASPLFLKAVLRAVVVALSDFSEQFSSPTRMVVLFLFVVTGVAAPLVKAFVAVLVHNVRARRARRRADESDSDSDSDADDRGFRIVDVGSPWPPRTPLRLRLPFRASRGVETSP